MLKTMGIDLAQHKWVRVGLNALVLVALLLGLSATPFLESIAPNVAQLSPVGAEVAQAATCRYFNAWPVDEGGGTWNDKNRYIYVSGTQDGRGEILVQVSNLWLRTYYKPVGIRNGYLAFGVSTWRSYLNPGWKDYKYQYKLCV